MYPSDLEIETLGIKQCSELAIRTNRPGSHRKLPSFLQSLRLHLDYTGIGQRKKGRGGSATGNLEYAQKDAWASAYSTVAAGAALIAGIGVMAYLKRSAS